MYLISVQFSRNTKKLYDYACDPITLKQVPESLKLYMQDKRVEDVKIKYSTMMPPGKMPPHITKLIILCSNKRGVVKDFDRQSFIKENKEENNMYNNHEYVKKLKEKYLGKAIEILDMDGEPEYTGRTGVVSSVDDMGQLHGRWVGADGRSGSLAVNPECDSIKII
ncbi:MAG: DUF4314 domain-containing protein [Methanobrevibacter sp.]|nr:DUF4314 domain-containing protein [Methanobrevibacter sp.]